jgi:hypothetical protein
MYKCLNTLRKKIRALMPVLERSGEEIICETCPSSKTFYGSLRGMTRL